MGNDITSKSDINDYSWYFKLAIEKWDIFGWDSFLGCHNWYVWDMNGKIIDSNWIWIFEWIGYRLAIQMGY